VKLQVGWALYVKELKDFDSGNRGPFVDPHRMNRARLCDEFHKPHKPCIGTVTGNGINSLTDDGEEFGEDVGFLFPVLRMVLRVAHVQSLFHLHIT